MLDIILVYSARQDKDELSTCKLAHPHSLVGGDNGVGEVLQISNLITADMHHSNKKIMSLAL